MTRTLLIPALFAAALGARCSALQAAGPVTWGEWPPAPLWAQSRPFGEGPRIIERASFGALDTNYDFSLSREEAAASPVVYANFSSFDRDGDERLAPLEFNNIVLALSAG